VLACAGCGLGHGSAAPSGQVVDVEEKDFAITAPKEIAAGDVTFHVVNAGPTSHELLLARLPQGGLPYRTDRLTIDEESLDQHELWALEPEGTGASRNLRVNLPAGRYVLFCNMSGHYLGGMRTLLVVR
jgi:uncharacterized cupredoxin-like copper-binding protein